MEDEEENLCVSGSLPVEPLLTNNDQKLLVVTPLTLHPLNLLQTPKTSLPLESVYANQFGPYPHVVRPH